MTVAQKLKKIIEDNVAAVNKVYIDKLPQSKKGTGFILSNLGGNFNNLGISNSQMGHQEVDLTLTGYAHAQKKIYEAMHAVYDYLRTNTNFPANRIFSLQVQAPVFFEETPLNKTAYQIYMRCFTLP